MVRDHFLDSVYFVFKPVFRLTAIRDFINDMFSVRSFGVNDDMVRRINYLKLYNLVHILFFECFHRFCRISCLVHLSRQAHKVS